MEKTEERGIGSGLCFHTHYSNIPVFQYFGIQIEMLSTDKEIQL